MEISDMIYKVHDAMEGRDELTGYDLHMIHGTLCEITPRIEAVSIAFAEWIQFNHFVYTTSPTDLNHKYWVRKLASIITTRNIYTTEQLFSQFFTEFKRNEYGK